MASSGRRGIGSGAGGVASSFIPSLEAVQELENEIAALEQQTHTGMLLRERYAKILSLDELKESRRVAAVPKDAVESGLMKPEFAIRAEEESLLCFERLHWEGKPLSMFACCGEVICRDCEMKCVEAAFTWETDSSCPFCREPTPPFASGAYFMQCLRNHGEKPWAPEQLALLIIDRGEGSPGETEEALRLLEIGAGRGRMLSQERLGSLYLYGNMGEATTVPVSLDKAKVYLLKAIYQGRAIALEAMTDLLEIEEDVEERVRYVTLAAAQGAIECQFLLAMSFAYGLGAQLSKGRAIFCAKRLALQGHVEAQALCS